MSGQELLIILLVGLIAGWLAGQISAGHGVRSYSRHRHRNCWRTYRRLAFPAIKASISEAAWLPPSFQPRSERCCCYLFFVLPTAEGRWRRHVGFARTQHRI